MSPRLDRLCNRILMPSEGIERDCRLLILFPVDFAMKGFPANNALFVRLDMAHLSTIRTSSLRCLCLAASVRGCRGGCFAIDRWRHGGCAGGGASGGVDAFRFFALVPAFAVLFQPGELVGNTKDISGEKQRIGVKALPFALAGVVGCVASLLDGEDAINVSFKL